jgi:hypothetical protein
MESNYGFWMLSFVVCDDSYKNKNKRCEKWHVRKWNIYFNLLPKKTNVCIKLELI